MKILAAALLGSAVLASSAEAGSPYPIHIERQYGSTLVIKHTPVPGEPVVTRIYRRKVVRKHRLRPARAAAVRKVRRDKVLAYWNPALAGGCRDGGYVHGVLPNGTPVALHKDICEGIAPIYAARRR
jgi:hypothetical protein